MESAINEFDVSPNIELVLLDIGIPESDDGEYDETRGDGLKLIGTLAERENGPRIVLFCYRFPEVDILERIQRARYQSYQCKITLILVQQTDPKTLDRIIEQLMMGSDQASIRLPILDMHVNIDCTDDTPKAIFKERYDRIWMNFGELERVTMRTT